MSEIAYLNPAKDEKSDIEIVDGTMPFIPEGIYQARIVDWETKKVFGKTSRLYIEFKLCELGHSLIGTRLMAHYGIESIKGKPRRRGKFTLGRRHRLLEEMGRFQHLAKIKRNGLSLDALTTVIMQVKVKTVTRTYQGQSRSSLTQYSKVAAMLGPVET